MLLSSLDHPFYDNEYNSLSSSVYAEKGTSLRWPPLLTRPNWNLVTAVPWRHCIRTLEYFVYPEGSLLAEMAIFGAVFSALDDINSGGNLEVWVALSYYKP